MKFYIKAGVLLAIAAGCFFAWHGCDLLHQSSVNSTRPLSQDEIDPKNLPKYQEQVREKYGELKATTRPTR